MTEQRLTAEQIIDETVEFYRNNPRAFDTENHSCVYLDQDGNKCAHSRCIDPEQVNLEQIHHFTCAQDLIKKHDDNIHLEKYRGHSPEFWGKIQDLHDLDKNWTPTKRLSKAGKEFVRKLKMDYANTTSATD